MEITVPQVAARTGLTPETIRRWIRGGKLPARKVGTQHLIQEEDLERLTAKPKGNRVGEQAPTYVAGPNLDSLLGRIVCDPKILVGRPTIRGSRISVELILECLAEGITIPEFLDAYPGIAETDIRAALAFAALRIGSEKVYPVRTP